MLGRERTSDFIDGLFQIGIVLRKTESRLVKTERFAELAAAMMDFCDATNGGEIFGGVFEDKFQFGLCGIEIVHLEECAAERDARRQISRMDGEPATAGLNRVFIAASPAVLFRKLRKRNRRRVLLDPASKFFNTGIICHEPTVICADGDAYEIVISVVVRPICPTSSVTVSTTTYVPAAAKLWDAVTPLPDVPSPQLHW